MGATDVPTSRGPPEQALVAGSGTGSGLVTEARLEQILDARDERREERLFQRLVMLLSSDAPAALGPPAGQISGQQSPADQETDPPPAGTTAKKAKADPKKKEQSAPTSDFPRTRSASRPPPPGDEEPGGSPASLDSKTAH